MIQNTRKHCKTLQNYLKGCRKVFVASGFVFAAFFPGTGCLVFGTVWNKNLSFCIVFATFWHGHYAFCMVFATLRHGHSAFAWYWLHFGMITLHFAWYLLHLAMFAFHFVWYLYVFDTFWHFSFSFPWYLLHFDTSNVHVGLLRVLLAFIKGVI